MTNTLWIPLVMTDIAIENGSFLVELPIILMVIFHIFLVCLPEGTSLQNWHISWDIAHIVTTYWDFRNHLFSAAIFAIDGLMG